MRYRWGLMTHLAMTAMVILLPVTMSGADTLHVPGEHGTIQEAIDIAADGDEIVVAPGVYNELINLQGKRIHLNSSNGSDETVIDGAGLDGSVISCVSGETEKTVIEGFTITRGKGTANSQGQRWGGAAYLEWSSCTFCDCTFRDNSTDYTSAIAAVYPSTEGALAFYDCTFEENYDAYAWGCINARSLLLSGCVFRHNSSGVQAGQVRVSDCLFEDQPGRCVGGGSVKVAGTTFLRGGVCVRATDRVVVDNSIFCFNENAAINCLKGEIVATNCLFEGNAGSIVGRYTDIFVDNCDFADNSGGLGGAAIYLDIWFEPGESEEANVVVQKSTFAGNTAPRGGSVYFVDEAWGSISTSLEMRDCEFSNNSATEKGGAIYLQSVQEVSIERCSFQGNAASQEGGGVWLYGEGSLESCAFVGNFAVDGGGIYLVGRDSPHKRTVGIKQCDFIHNQAGHRGGGISVSNMIAMIINSRLLGNRSHDVGGGVVLTGLYASVQMANSILVGNSAINGGGAVSICDSTQVQMADVVLSENTAPSGSVVLFDNALGATIENSILWGNEGSLFYSLPESPTPSIRYSLVEGGYNGPGNINADPFFVRGPSPGADDVWGSDDDDFGNLRLRAGSPAIDAADNDTVSLDVLDLDDDSDTTEPIPFDLDGNLRFVADPDTVDTGNGTPPIVDMGAYEFQVNAVCPGDIDGDGDTDQSDLGLLLAAYEIDDSGDLDGDGDTDQADLGLLLADYECGT
jgi:predicted outer membrane repeat protein